MQIIDSPALTYDDVLLVPQHSDLVSRSEANTEVKIGNLYLRVPIFSANMDSITGPAMVHAMGAAGGRGVLHRYTSPEVIVSWLKEMPENLRIPSVGIRSAAAEMYIDFTTSICLDVAHGDHLEVVNEIKRLYMIGYKTIIAGNVATRSGARSLLDAGANVIKVGVGPGAVCTTRSVTGHGVPQLSAVMDVAEVVSEYKGATSIADGGLKNSGDIVKALAAGADAVMTGSLLAGTDEAARPHEYRGMASHDAQVSFRGEVGNGVAEGVTQTDIKSRGPVGKVIAELAAGIRSGMSYSGARDLKELKEYALFRVVTANAIVENGTRRP
jgi:IMP dehydrogenase